MGIRQPIGSWEWQPTGTGIGPYALALNHVMDASTTHRAADYEPIIVGSPGQLQGAIVKLSSAPGSGHSRTYDLYKNGAPAGCQLVFGEADVLKRDDDFTLDCVAGDRLWWQDDPLASGAHASNVLIAQWFYNTTPKRWWSSAYCSIWCAGGSGTAVSWDATVNGGTGEYLYPYDRVALFAQKLVSVRWFGKAAVPVGTTITWRIVKNYVVQATFTSVAGETSGSWTGEVSLAAGDHFHILPSAAGGPAGSIYVYVSQEFENVSHTHAIQRTSRDGVGAQLFDPHERWTNIAQNDYGVFTAEASVICYVHKGLRVRGYGERWSGNTYVLDQDRFYRTWVAQQGGALHWQKDYKSTGSSLRSYVNFHDTMDVALVDEFTTAAEFERLSIKYNGGLGSDGHPYQKQLANSLWIEASAVPAPTLCTPASAIQSQTLDVLITGTNLGEVTAVAFGGSVTVNSFTVDSDSQITANITCGAVAETVDVVLTNPKGTGTLASGFQVLPGAPVVTSVTPSSGLQGAL
jgi:hypothetical protein